MESIEAVLHLLPEAFLVLTAEGVVCVANERAASILGFACGELTGCRLEEFVEESPARLAELKRQWGRSGQLLPGILVLRNGDGERQRYRCEGGRLQLAPDSSYLLLRIVPRDASVARFILLNERIEQLGKEISRRRRAEASLEEQRKLTEVTLASIGDAVIATDERGRVTFINAMAQAYTQWSAHEAIGLPLRQVFVIVNETTREPVQDPVAKVMETGAIVGLANHTVLLRRDGTELPIEDSAAPIRDGGRILGIVLVFRDVSERRTYENQREQADRRRDEYLAMLAHELRNPLAVIGNGVALLRRLPLEGLPQPEVERLGKIGAMLDRHMQHLTRLVDDLLDVARITSGKIALQRFVQPLNAIVAQAVEMTRHLLAERSTKLEIVQPSEPLTVNADSHRLAQAITNLLTNAAKFSAIGTSIALVMEATREEVVVRVRDSGIGIEPEMLPRVFDLFSQADQSLARTQGGLGIGLTVVRSLVEMHGGRVEAHSGGLGRGSEFIVRLPRPGASSQPSS